ACGGGTLGVALRPLGVMLPIRPVRPSAAQPASVSAVLLASAVASTVTTSPAPLAVTELAPDPVAIAMPLSAASPVVTVNAPVREFAVTLPTSPLTVSPAEPPTPTPLFSTPAAPL